MQTEYLSLAYMTLFFLFAWFPVSIGKAGTFGLKWLASNRTPVQGKELSGWSARADRAYNNLKDFFPAFAVAVILLGLNGKFDQGTHLASIIYVVGRTGHYISYTLGNFPARFVFFVAGLLSNTYLLIKLFI